jgi:DNA repair protein RadC
MTIRLKQNDVQVTSPKALWQIMKEVLTREKLIDKRKEHGWVASLDPQHKLLNLELVSMGTANFVHLNPTDVFRVAILKNAAKIVLIHNHPAGSLNPSTADDGFTEHVMGVGDFLKVPVFDHLIITEAGYFSYRENGRMKRLQGNVNLDVAMPDTDWLKLSLRNAKEEIEKLKQKLKQAPAPKKTPAKKALKNKPKK